jgi:hypothetical protein
VKRVNIPSPPELTTLTPSTLLLLEQWKDEDSLWLLGQMAGWRSGLVRFRTELDLDPGQWDHMTRHRWDWVGLLHLRSMLDLSLLDPRVPKDAHDWVERIDEFMRSFTEVVADWNIDPDPPEPAWWWERLPTRGPTRAGWWADK